MARTYSNTEEEVFYLEIKVDGTILDASVNIVSAEVEQAVNQISRATIVIEDIPSLSEFPRGSEIEIQYLYDTKPEEPIFKGLIVNYGISTNDGERLTFIECYDEAIALSVESKTQYFSNMKISDVIKAVIDASDTKVILDDGSTNEVFPVIAQTKQSDWDFITALALSQDKVVINKNGKLSIVTPKPKPKHVAIVFSLGDNILNIEGSLGDVSFDTEALPLGLVQSNGNVNAQVGHTLRLKGLGEFFDGVAFTSGISHTAEAGVWTTTYAFGIDFAALRNANNESARLTAHSGNNATDLFPDHIPVDNLFTTLTSANGHSVIVDEVAHAVTVTSADGNRIVLDDDNQSVSLEDNHDNKIVLNNSAITITGSRDVNIVAGDSINLSAGKNIKCEATDDIINEAEHDHIVNASNITLDANVALKAKGNAAAELTSSGTTVVRGAMVLIN